MTESIANRMAGSTPTPVPRGTSITIVPPSEGLCFAPQYNRNRVVSRADDDVRYAYGADRRPPASSDPLWHRHNASDATGEFRPGAVRFHRLHGAHWSLGPQYIWNGHDPVNDEGDDNQSDENGYAQVAFNNLWVPRLAQIRGLIDAHRGAPYGVVAFFCHGFEHGTQLGPGMKTERWRTETEAFLRALGAKAKNDLLVVFYSCDTAHPYDNGPSFAGWVQNFLHTECDLRDCVVYGRTTHGVGTTNPNTKRFAGDRSADDAGEWVVPPGDSLFNTWHAALTADLVDADGRPTEDFKCQFPFMTTQEIRDYLGTLSRPERQRRRRPRSESGADASVARAGDHE
jgi:hypothetical protein